MEAEGGIGLPAAGEPLSSFDVIGSWSSLQNFTTVR